MSFRIGIILFPLTIVWRINQHFDKIESNTHSSTRSSTHTLRALLSYKLFQKQGVLKVLNDTRNETNTLRVRVKE